jgi:O-acetyl-ADP-ribose deacetylase (regulator of RNase III)
VRKCNPPRSIVWVHTVGPVWKGGTKNAAALLAQCYEHSLKLAVEKHLRSIAFPAISRGAYAYPLNEATEIAIREVRRFTSELEAPQEVVFCCYSGEHLAAYKKLMR